MLLTNLRPFWFIILCVPAQLPPFWNFSGFWMVPLNGFFFIQCALSIWRTHSIYRLLPFSTAKSLISSLLLSLELLTSVVLMLFFQILIFSVWSPIIPANFLDFILKPLHWFLFHISSVLISKSSFWFFESSLFIQHPIPYIHSYFSEDTKFI